MSETTDLLYEIVGEAMSIQRERGPAHVESVYHDLLAARLRVKGHQVNYKPSLWLQDDLGNYIKKYQPDLRVSTAGTSVLVELKASQSHLSDANQRQARAYLSVSTQDEAVLLLNLGLIPFEHKRIYQRRSEDRPK